jgi:hypothetical protein
MPQLVGKEIGPVGFGLMGMSSGTLGVACIVLVVPATSLHTLDANHPQV